MYRVYIANKNYSSWSLRPWVLMRELGIAFDEQLLRFGSGCEWESFRKLSPSGKVPCLVDGDTVVWDSLAIAEYLAERHEGVWPQESRARAWARCAAAEMHSGFAQLRSRCSMSCGVRVTLGEISQVLAREIARIESLWNDGLTRFGGPFLAGRTFTAADAFFAPVVFRAQTYGLQLDAVSTAYVRRMLKIPAMQQWYTAALAETFRDEAHDADIEMAGTVVQDFRQRGHTDR